MADVVFKTDEGAKRKRLALVIGCVLIAVVLIGGGTLAYLTVTTNTASNMFTAGNIDAELIEASWEPAEEPDGTSGSEIAEGMLPGVTAPKDPLIKNTSTSPESEYTGMLLLFERADTLDADGKPDSWVPMTDEEVATLLVGVGTVAAPGTVSTPGLSVGANWGARIDTAEKVTAVVPGQQVFIYNTTIAQDESTDPIFAAVGIIPAASANTWDGTAASVTADNFMTWLHDPNGCNGYFRITVKGAAVQASGVSQEEAQKTILTMLGYTTV